MGVLNIVECDRVLDEGRIQVAHPISNGSNITTSGTSARTGSDFSGSTKYVRVVADADVYIRLGDSSVAAIAGDLYLPAGVVDYIPVKGGQTRIAAIEK